MSKRKESEIDQYVLPTSTAFKGIVTAISEPLTVETKFGNRKYVKLTVEHEGETINVNLWLPQSKIIHPRSTLYKVLKKYNCTRIRDLIGKQIELYVDNNGFLRLLV